MHFKKQTWIIHQACTKFDGNLPPFNLNFVSENLGGNSVIKKLIIVDLFHQKTFEKVIFLCVIINFAINLFFFLWLSFDLSQLVDMLKKLFSQCILAKFLAMSKPSKLLWSCLVKSRKLFCVVFMRIIIFIWNGPFSLIMVSMQTFSINFVINVMSDS